MSQSQSIVFLIVVSSNPAFLYQTAHQSEDKTERERQKQNSRNSKSQVSIRSNVHCSDMNNLMFR